MDTRRNWAGMVPSPSFLLAACGLQTSWELLLKGLTFTPAGLSSASSRSHSVQIPLLSSDLWYNCRQVTLSLFLAAWSRESGLKGVMGSSGEEIRSVRAEVSLAVCKQTGCFFSYSWKKTWHGGDCYGLIDFTLGVTKRSKLIFTLSSMVLLTCTSSLAYPLWMRALLAERGARPMWLQRGAAVIHPSHQCYSSTINLWVAGTLGAVTSNQPHAMS